MAPGVIRVGSAARHDQVRPMTPSERAEYEEHTQAVRAAIASGRVDDAAIFRLQIVNGQVLDGAEHGFGDGATLCGIPQADVFLMRHWFYPNQPSACSACAAALGRDPI
jgi:hypothetical protein